MPVAHIISSPRVCALGLIVAALLSGCASSPSPDERSVASPKDAAAAAHENLRERVRGWAGKHCGSCHQASAATAKPAALGVFNLDASDWSASLSPARWRMLAKSLGSKLDDDGRQQLSNFVEREIVLREK